LVLRDLDSLSIHDVFVDGRLVVDSDGTCVAGCPAFAGGVQRGAIDVHVTDERFRIDAPGGASEPITIRVIEAASDQILTQDGRATVQPEGGEIRADVSRDLLKVAVVERHRGTGRVGLGFVRGFGLQDGALASSVAHDAHNIVVVGTSDHDMAAAVNHLAGLGGGQVVVRQGRVAASLPLPIAGLMSECAAAEVAASERSLRQAAHDLGSSLAQPFMTLSFLALPVIPHLKLTDSGLIDVDRFQRVPLFTDL
jgi:adenine deaminase